MRCIYDSHAHQMGAGPCPSDLAKLYCFSKRTPQWWSPSTSLLDLGRAKRSASFFRSPACRRDPLIAIRVLRLRRVTARRPAAASPTLCEKAPRNARGCAAGRAARRWPRRARNLARRRRGLRGTCRTASTNVDMRLTAGQLLIHIKDMTKRPHADACAGGRDGRRLCGAPSRLRNPARCRAPHGRRGSGGVSRLPLRAPLSYKRPRADPRRSPP